MIINRKKQPAKAFRILKIFFVYICVLLLSFAGVVYFSVQQWATTEEGRLPVKTAVVLHAVNENLVTPDIKRPSFLAGSGTSTLKREEIMIPVRDGANIRARMYRPSGDGPYPIVMYYHGGAFLEGYGNIDTHDNIVRSLAARTNSVVISVGYRLAPEYVFPTAIEDSYDALVWAVESADTFNGDSTKVVVAGDSAGGNIATAVAIMTNYEQGPQLQAQILYYPLTTFNDLSFPSREQYDSGYFLLSRGVMNLAREKYTPEEYMWSSPYTSPLEAPDLSGLPPTLIITAEFDPLRDEGEAYARRLAESGVPVRAQRYNGVMHGFISFFEVMDVGKHGLQQTSYFLKQVLHEETVPAQDTFTVTIIDQPSEKKFREQVEAYAIASFLISKQASSIIPLRY